MCGSTCSCKAGSDGACKHVAAVALKLNNIADAKSSTDMPQMWGRPASKPNTSKKESIEELFGGRETRCLAIALSALMRHSLECWHATDCFGLIGKT